jgi:hypothetical protein
MPILSPNMVARAKMDEIIGVYQRYIKERGELSFTPNVTNFNTQMNTFNAEITRLEDYRLIKDPLALTNDLSQAALAEFRKFELDFPTEQSLVVRQCLHLIETKLDAISTRARDAKRHRTNIADHYYELFGMLELYRMKLAFEVIETSDVNLKANTALRFILESLLKTYSVSFTNKLFVYGCSYEFQKLMQTYPFAFSSAGEEFYQIELKDYTYAINQTKILLTSLKKNVLYSHNYTHLNKVLFEAQKLIDLTDGNLTKKQPPFKFLTTILQTTNKIVTKNLLSATPLLKKIQSLNEYKKLIEHYKTGAPNIFKKLLGAVLAFVGTVLLGLCIAANITTMGILSPISTYGMVAGASTMLLGYGLFKNGSRDGLSQALNNVSNELSNEISNQQKAIELSIQQEIAGIEYLRPPILR